MTAGANNSKGQAHLVCPWVGRQQQGSLLPLSSRLLARRLLLQRWRCAAGGNASRQGCSRELCAAAGSQAGSGSASRQSTRHNLTAGGGALREQPHPLGHQRTWRGGVASRHMWGSEQQGFHIQQDHTPGAVARRQASPPSARADPQLGRAPAAPPPRPHPAQKAGDISARDRSISKVQSNQCAHIR